MITRIELRNFQRHEYLSLSLDRITTLIGDTDQGKTAIVRAVCWVALGKPVGNSFITHGKSKCRVSLWLASGHRVVKQRGRTTPTRYKLIRPDGSESTFKATGSTVPEPITNVLNLDRLNFQLQLDPPLWLTDSPGQVARHLNAIVNLDDIDRALSLVAGKVRSAKAVVEVSTQRAADLTDTIANLEWVEQCNTDFQQIQLQQTKLDELRSLRQELREAVGRVRTQVELSARLLGGKNRGLRLLSLARSQRLAEREAASLRKLIARTLELQDRRTLRLPSVHQMESEWNVIQEMEYTLAHIEVDGLQDVQYLIENATRHNSIRNDLNRRLDILRERLARVRRCPLCNRPIKGTNHGDC